MNGMILKAAVLSISLLLMSSPAVSPALADISAALPSADSSQIMLIASLPSIVMVVFSLIYGKLVDIMSKRAILGISAACFFIGGVGPAFLNDITSILLMRGIFGISMGFLMPLSTVLITDFFEGSERQSMMGWQSATINFGGIIFPMIAGILCAINWHYTFFAYLLGILVFAFVFFFLPEPAKLELTADGNQPVKSKHLSGKVWLLQLSLFVYMIAFMAFVTNVAMKILVEKLGDAASAGLAFALFTFGGLVAGLIFGKITQIITKFTVPVGWMISGIGLILLATAQSYNIIIVGCFIAGVGYAIAMPGTFVKLAMLTAPPAIDFGFSVAFGIMGIGQFISPSIFEFVNKISGHGPGSFPMLVGGAIMLGAGLLLLIGSVGGSSKATTEMLSK